jgi:hypothetical protein
MLKSPGAPKMQPCVLWLRTTTLTWTFCPVA